MIELRDCGPIILANYNAHEIDAPSLEILEQFDQMWERAPRPIQFPHHERIGNLAECSTEFERGLPRCLPFARMFG